MLNTEIKKIYIYKVWMDSKEWDFANIGAVLGDIQLEIILENYPSFISSFFLSLFHSYWGTILELTDIADNKNW